MSTENTGVYCTAEIISLSYFLFLFLANCSYFTDKNRIKDNIYILFFIFKMSEHVTCSNFIIIKYYVLYIHNNIITVKYE